ncbi:peroxisome assembly factor 2-like protein, partial [Ochromonadaceae sp. CCMP2298]
LPQLYPHLFFPGCPRRQGVLLYGPPGTGKTLVARAVATECQMNFISVKGPELLDAYVGESEKNVRELFARARAEAPCVLFFDEIDSLAPARARGNDSGGGVMDRIVSQLLTEIDQIASSKFVFIIAATNRPDLLDPALLRPGRFDRKIYLGVCKTPESRLQILCAQTRKFELAADVDLTAVAARLPLNITGADIGAVTSAAFSRALQRKL